MTTAPTIAPFGLLRVAALPADRLTPLTLPSVQRYVTELADLEETLASLRAEVTSHLHALVPRVGDEAELRGQVVNLKRDVHNDRAERLDPALLERISGELGPAERANLLAWRDGVRRRASLHEALDAVLPRDLDSAGQCLAESLQSPDLRGGVASSSDAFYATLDSARPGRWGNPEHRDARTLVAYLARTAVKTSPFSSFTTLRLLFSHALQPAPRRRLRSHIIPLLRVTLLEACARDLHLAPAFLYEVIPTWTAADGRLRALLPRTVIEGDFCWRTETGTEMTLYAEAIRTLAAAGRASHARLMECLPGRHPRLTLQRLLDTGIVRVVAPWTDDDACPLAALARTLETLGNARAAAVSALVRAIGDADAELDHPDVEHRRAARHGLRSHTLAALADLQVSPPSWATSGKIAYEDVADVSLPSGETPPPGLAEDLRQLAGLVRPGLFRTRLYDEVREAFVARFGRGGACAGLMGFLDEFLARPDIASILGRVTVHDLARRSDPSPEPAAPLGSPSSALPAATVLFQVAAADREAMMRGDYLVVVNRYSAGLGGLLTRLAPLFPGPGGLADGLRAWVQGCYPGARVAELLPARDVNSLEDASRGLFPKLRWPADGATLTTGGTLGFDELRLTHDDRSDTLVLRAADGRPVATPNLGSVPDHLVFGPLRLLLAIANPWIVGSRLADRAPTVLRPGAAPTEVTPVPRDQRGRLVLKRARWLMPGRLFPLRSKADSDRRYLLRVETWRRAHGLPQEVFLNVAGSLAGGFDKDRKPRWLCFSSLHALAAVKGVVSENLEGTLALVEALPARSQHWARDHDGQARATEQMALLRWEDDPSHDAGEPSHAD